MSWPVVSKAKAFSPPISLISVIKNDSRPQRGMAPPMTSGPAGSGLRPAHAESTRGAISEIGGKKAFRSGPGRVAISG
ncbi:hypothetical protein [Geothrix alkalitolerans]|uniref:hypothetical protein n=1 Tax=Geothrix alkalitolerans TaxID=2922724 RepID=UPI001FAF83C9|nr:hypothetical protein [Geothrix alkalitolerans]